MFEMNPTSWMMVIVFGVAFVNHFMGYLDKRMEDPDMSYRWSYFKQVVMGSLAVAVSISATVYTTIGIPELFQALILGLGGKSFMSEASKVVIRIKNKDQKLDD